MVLSLLQARRDWPARTLAQRLDIFERTVRRDVDRLRELGYRIRAVKGPDGGYRLDAGSELPPLLFDDEQAIALTVALQNEAGAGSGFDEPALRALATVRQVLPTRLRERIDGLRFTAVPDSPRDAPRVPTDLLLAVSAAARDREILRFDYDGPVAAGEPAGGGDPARDPRDLQPPRRVEPHHLVARNGRWYLVAWDLDRDDWRIFRVDRLTPRTPTGPRFIPRELPGGDVRTFVAARFKGGDGKDEWPCRGEAILRASASDLAPYLAPADLDDLGGGRCRVRLGAWSWTSLAASFGRLDTDLDEVRPPELARAFDDLAHRFRSIGSSAGSEASSD